MTYRATYVNMVWVVENPTSTIFTTHTSYDAARREAQGCIDHDHRVTIATALAPPRLPTPERGMLFAAIMDGLRGTQGEPLKKIVTALGLPTIDLETIRS